MNKTAYFLGGSQDLTKRVVNQELPVLRFAIEPNLQTVKIQETDIDLVVQICEVYRLEGVIRGNLIYVYDGREND